MQQLTVLWWPATRPAPQPEHGQRGKPSPASVARRARRDQAIAAVFGRLPGKGIPRRDSWEHLVNGAAQPDPDLLPCIDAALAEFGDGFRVSGRTAERAWKKAPDRLFVHSADADEMEP